MVAVKTVVIDVEEEVETRNNRGSLQQQQQQFVRVVTKFRAAKFRTKQ
jgi:hypothetical protein